MIREQQNIFVGEGAGQKLAAVISVDFEPLFMEPLEIEKFVQDASIRLAEELAIKLNGLREN